MGQVPVLFRLAEGDPLREAGVFHVYAPAELPLDKGGGDVGVPGGQDGLDDGDLFPPGAVQLNGRKLYAETQERAVSLAASMARAAGSGLERIIFMAKSTFSEGLYFTAKAAASSLSTASGG